MDIVNPGPAEPGYVLPLQTVQIQISWLLKKPTDLDLHCLPLSMWTFTNNLDLVIWLAENWKWVWHVNLFSMARVKYLSHSIRKRTFGDVHTVVTKTCLYNFDALKPHFYIPVVKQGFQGFALFFLFLLKNIDCEYSLELPQWGCSKEYPQSMFWAEIWKISEFYTKIFIFWW